MSRPLLRDVLALGGACAVVTGASTGLGRRVALRLAAAGARVVVACGDRAEGEETVRQINTRGGEAHFVRITGATSDDARRTLQACADVFGRIDILVNHGGSRLFSAAAARRMIEDVHGGSIVDIDRLEAWRPSASPLADDGSRAALALMTGSLAISRYEVSQVDADDPPGDAQRQISSALSRFLDRGDTATAAVCLASRAAAGLAGVRVGHA
jgi:NAD(P)-dependent dehydrogenase (short-subunit alcohol dehydrogenase family)